MSNAYFWLADCNSRITYYLRNGKSQISGTEVSRFPGTYIRGDWLVWFCTINTWSQDVWRLANDETIRYALLSDRRRLSSTWRFDLCSKATDFSHDENWCWRIRFCRPSSPRVDIPVNLIYTAPPTNSSTSWWSSLRWPNWLGYWMPLTTITSIESAYRALWYIKDIFVTSL